jgi:hypothetical protein
MQMNALLAVYGRGARTRKFGNVTFGRAFERQSAA